jgi:hypothetical protein
MDDSEPGDNGLFGGQGEPLGAFTLALAAAQWFDRRSGLMPTPSDGEDAEETARFIWGAFARLLALIQLIALASLRSQLLGLGGAQGICPGAAMLARARKDMAAPLRWMHFPALHLWLDCSDLALLSTCDMGMIAAALAVYGGSASPACHVLGWAVWVSLNAAIGFFQYPWDCLLMESLFAVGWLLPAALPLHDGALALAGLPSIEAVWVVRLLLLRVMLGMGKFKFSRGWSHKNHRLYLRGFLCWQPLPTPLARWLVQAVPSSVFVGLYRATCARLATPYHATGIHSICRRNFASRCAHADSPVPHVTTRCVPRALHSSRAEGLTALRFPNPDRQLCRRDPCARPLHVLLAPASRHCRVAHHWAAGRHPRHRQLWCLQRPHCGTPRSVRHHLGRRARPSGRVPATGTRGASLGA